MSQKAETAKYIGMIACKFGTTESIDKFKLKLKLEVVCIQDSNNAHLVRTDTMYISQKMHGHTFIFCPKHKEYIDVTDVEPNGFV